jgi:hypothetical protein
MFLDLSFDLFPRVTIGFRGHIGGIRLGESSLPPAYRFPYTSFICLRRARPAGNFIDGTQTSIA